MVDRDVFAVVLGAYVTDENDFRAAIRHCYVVRTPTDSKVYQVGELFGQLLPGSFAVRALVPNAGVTATFNGDG